MSRVITFSRVFPAYHPRAGQPTNFIRKILKARHLSGHLSAGDILKISREIGLMGLQDIKSVHQFLSDTNQIPKHHTIRGTEKRKWTVGEKFSPRAWSGKPYKSKQLHLGPDIEIVDVYDVEITYDHVKGMNFEFAAPILNTAWREDFIPMGLVGKNDGLNMVDFVNWFPVVKEPFIGQIICWTPKLYA